MKLLERFTAKSNKEALNKLVGSLKELRQRSDIAVLSPMPTGYEWLGVYNGGKSMFSEYFIDLPHYYSQSVFNQKELDALAKTIIGLSFKQLYFNGFPAYFESFITKIKNEQPGVKTAVIYHGFPAELSGNKKTQAAVNGMVHLTQQKKLDKIGFAKKGFGLAFQQLYKIPCYELIYYNPEPLTDVKKINDGKIHVGVLVNNSFRKNFHTQVMAALLIENSIVHVMDNSELAYLESESRIIAHGHQNHDEFLRLLSTMDINFHVTFSEASGGQVCSESISQGVPCVSGYTSAFFDYDEEMKKAMVVEGYDDPYSIFLKAKEVLAKRDELSKKCLAYSAHLNILAKERVKTFIAA
jgi:hypothetical protein